METGNHIFSTKFDLKSVKDSGEFSGYGNVFNVEDNGGDVVVKGAFAQTIAEWKAKQEMPPILWQHSSREPIGVLTGMKEDDHGLFVEGKLTLAVSRAAEAYALLKDGAIKGMSIGYSVAMAGETIGATVKDGIRYLTNLKLWEMSLVTFPMNELSRVERVKSFLSSGTLPEERVFEGFLREAGFSRAQAKQLISEGFRSLKNQRDADPDRAALKSSLERLEEKIKAAG